MHKDQFTATGPSQTGAGFPRAAFSTNESSDTGTYGVHVQGTQCGVYGDSLKTDSTGLTDPHNIAKRLAKEGTGVYGTGESYGVYGSSNLFTLELGGDTTHQILPPSYGSSSKGAIGVVGASLHVPGIVGSSNISISDTVNNVMTTDITGQPIGVVGISKKSTGIFGLSLGAGALPSEVVIGLQKTGVFGFSQDGAGVRGTSNRDRGGIFETVPNPVIGGPQAQLRLVPHKEELGQSGPKLPKNGKAGDLLVSSNIDGQATLFFCVHDPIGNTPAQWAPVLLGTQVNGNS